MTSPTASAILTPALSDKPVKPEANLGQWQLVWRGFLRHKLAVFSLWLLVILYLIAIFAEPIAPRDPNRRDIDFAYCPPQLPRFSFSEGLHAPALLRDVDPTTLRVTYTLDPNKTIHLKLFVQGDPYHLWGLIPSTRHLLNAANDEPYFPLGADRYGRDLLSRVISGARVSLSVGLIGIAFTFLFGILIGGTSGYVGGRTDTLIQRLIEIINSFPHLPLWLALGAVLPADWSPLQVYFAITLVLSLLSWTGLARVVRGKILSLREEDYALAARLLGASHTRILFRHLLPGFTSHIIVTLSLAVPGMILAETSLSFLGLGLRPPIVSWGVMLQDCMDVQAIRYYPWLMTPVYPIVLTVLAFNFVGDGLRDAADPYSTR